ncbi:hypothetical protein C8Q73DRAFT_662320 [Cubamyces lactineus]|nr:hypothetical protein C8Q73DRAFT_662320 [Cubamyces lactineus]
MSRPCVHRHVRINIPFRSTITNGSAWALNESNCDLCLSKSVRYSELRAAKALQQSLRTEATRSQPLTLLWLWPSSNPLCLPRPPERAVDPSQLTPYVILGAVFDPDLDRGMPWKTVVTELCREFRVPSLRDRLLERGMLEKIIPLFEKEVTRLTALCALRIIAERSTIHTLRTIARYNPILVKIAERAIVTMSLATTAIFDTSNAGLDALLAEEACVPLVLEANTNALRRPIHSHDVHIHVLRLFRDPVHEYAHECKAYPSLLKLFSALTQSEDITTRVVGMWALLLLYDPDCESAETNAGSQHPPRDDPMPRHLAIPLEDYGVERTETWIARRAHQDFLAALSQAREGRDMYALGKKIVNLIQCAELANVGDFREEEEQDALRMSGATEDLDAAPIIEMKLCEIREKHVEAVAIAARAFLRNEHHAYAYLTLSKTIADAREAYPIAKRVLRCSSVSTYMRDRALWQAVNLAAREVLVKLLGSRKTRDLHTAKEGTAYLGAAWDDSATYINEASSDAQEMLTVWDLNVILTFLLIGPRIEEDLRILDELREKIEFTTELMKFLGRPIAWKQNAATRELILSIYTDGAQEWGAFVRRYDELNTGFRLLDYPHSVAEHELGGGESHRVDQAELKTVAARFKLYRCTVALVVKGLIGRNTKSIVEGALERLSGAPRCTRSGWLFVYHCFELTAVRLSGMVAL